MSEGLAAILTVLFMVFFCGFIVALFYIAHKLDTTK